MHLVQEFNVGTACYVNDHTDKQAFQVVNLLQILVTGVLIIVIFKPNFYG